ncbi:MAG: hypothetical protein ACKV0T_16465 [Planctomycetales bacterium]
MLIQRLKNKAMNRFKSGSSRLVASCLVGATVLSMSLIPALGGNRPSGFSVEFTDCVESIGVTLLQTSEVEALIPPGFHVVGEGQPVTPVVVRSAHCRISVDGQRARVGTILQIGAVIVPPDFTGDINNYTLWYYTSDSKLAHHLKKLGMPVQLVPTINFQQIPSADDGPDSFQITVPRPGNPALSLAGEVVPSEASAGTFTANWWVETNRGTVKMQTHVPEILIGDADLVLTVEEDSSLSDLIGGPTLGFPILQQFNVFPTAQMDVKILAP